MTPSQIKLIRALIAAEREKDEAGAYRWTKEYRSCANNYTAAREAVEAMMREMGNDNK